MQLDHPPLHQGDQAFDVLDHQIVFVAPLHRDAGVEQVRRLLTRNVALEETLAAYPLGAPHHRQRPFDDEGQDAVAYGIIIVGQVELGDVAIGIDDAAGVRDTHAADLGVAHLGLRRRGFHRLVVLAFGFRVAHRLGHMHRLIAVNIARRLVFAQALE